MSRSFLTSSFSVSVSFLISSHHASLKCPASSIALQTLYPPAVPVSSIFRKQANTRCIPRSICAAFPKQTAAPVSEKRPAPVFLRAEAREHDDEIRDIERADEKADPAFEPALHERRDERTRAHDEARRNIQQHALPLDRQRLAEDERAQRHNEREVHDVRADDVAHRQRRLLLADGRDGRDKLRQRRADSDHGRADDGIRHTKHLHFHVLGGEKLPV